MVIAKIMKTIKNKKQGIICTFCVLVMLLNIAGNLTVAGSNGSNPPKIYINFADALAIESFVAVEYFSRTYMKTGCENTPDIMIRLDLNSRRIYKNQFFFPFDFEMRDDQIYMEQNNATAVFNVIFILDDDGKVVGSEPIHFDVHSWSRNHDSLVAHAGGTFGTDRRVRDTNSREAVIWSYNHGHRVFEIDFRLTTDNRLAAVHNWVGHGGQMSSEEWLQVRIWRVFTSMMLECVLDIMLVNRDMFLVTDTKSFEYTEEQTILQFQIIVDTAKRKDPTLHLLNRIIPQIYNQEMYDIIMNIYPFPSIIYTLYQSPDSDAEIVAFVRRHSNIRVVTMNPWRATPEFIRALRRINRQVYVFTINDIDEMRELRRRGVRGFYTSWIFPGDL